MEMKNKIMLITYSDSLGENLKELNQILSQYYKGIVGGVHILPFFPSSADRGFAPTRYDKVDESFGNWHDIHAIGDEFYMMFDFMINHISKSSPYFQDFLNQKDESEWKDMFIRYKDFWEGGEPTQKEVDKIYKRKPRAPYIDAQFFDGTSEKVWCTFGDEQIDLDVQSATTKEYITKTLLNLVKHRMSILRLDAFAYTIKKPGTSCFFIEPEIWNLLDGIQKIVEPYGVTILPEIHEHYSIQLKIAEKGYWVYDFALPMLVLSALYLGNARPLKNWLKICPRNQFTTLDTHDGIGVVDVAGLLTPEEIEKTKDQLFQKGANVKRSYNTEAYNNLDVYQINCTYYSALGNNDQAYLLARAIQFFAPGIPQVYYVGLLAGENDVELLEKTKQGRDINRHGYTIKEVEQNLTRPVVKKLNNLMKFRNSCLAFNGECVIADTLDNTLEIHRMYEGKEAVLRADMNTHEFEIEFKENESSLSKLILD